MGQNINTTLMNARNAAQVAEQARLKKEREKPAPKEQNAIAWLLGFKETDDQRKARETREANDKRTKESVTQAIKGYGVAKKLVKDAEKAK